MEESVIKESSPSLDLLLQFQRLLIARVFPKHNCYLASQADIGKNTYNPYMSWSSTVNLLQLIESIFV